MTGTEGGDWVIATFYRINRYDIHMRVIGGFGQDKAAAIAQSLRMKQMYIDAGGPPPVIQVVRAE
jgi:hypothetical protein